jgi:hypothetical protein
LRNYAPSESAKAKCPAMIYRRKGIKADKMSTLLNRGLGAILDSRSLPKKGEQVGYS